jgi:hypothetical protein
LLRLKKYWNEMLTFWRKKRLGCHLNATGFRIWPKMLRWGTLPLSKWRDSSKYWRAKTSLSSKSTFRSLKISFRARETRLGLRTKSWFRQKTKWTSWNSKCWLSLTR